MEQQIASAFDQVLTKVNSPKINYYKLLAELESTLIAHMAKDHKTQTSLAKAMKLKRTTLSMIMSRLGVSMHGK